MPVISRAYLNKGPTYLLCRINDGATFGGCEYRVENQICKPKEKKKCCFMFHRKKNRDWKEGKIK